MNRLVGLMVGILFLVFAGGAAADTGSHQAEDDTDGDGIVDRIATYDAADRLRRLQEDTNHDGRMDRCAHYTTDGRIARLEADENLDGRTDLWQYYRNEELVRLESDENGDGRADLRTAYAGGRPVSCQRDLNGNGRFEVTQTFGDDAGDSTIEVDNDENGVWEQHQQVRQHVVRVRAYDRDQDGTTDLIESYNAAAVRVRSEEAPLKDGRMTMVWHFDGQGALVRGEKDGNRDGRPDTWFSYSQGRLVKVAEDTNRDGSPDLWEYYDGSEKAVRRDRDLDFDGSPDVQMRDHPATRQVSGPPPGGKSKTISMDTNAK